MSKRNATEKEIEKARVERKWKNIVTLVNAFNIKNVQTSLSVEEHELYCCLHLGEAALEEEIEKHFHIVNPSSASISKEQLKGAYSYLSAAVTSSSKFKDSQPTLYHDARSLLSKYYFAIGEHKSCIEYVNVLELNHLEVLSKRSKCILAESLTCKGLSMECLALGDSLTEILACYKKAGELAFSIFMEDDSNGSLKRNATSSSAQVLTPLLETSLLQPAELLLSHCFIEEAIEHYRYILKAIETKPIYHIRKTIFRRLAEILLASTSPVSYNPPSTTEFTPSVPPHSPKQRSFDSTSPVNSMKSLRRSENLYCPRDAVEETAVVLLLSETMLCNNIEVNQTKEYKENRNKLTNEARSIFDLLVIALTRREQYHLLTQCFERNMKISFEEFHLWFQFALTLFCDGKYNRSLLILEQCHRLQPEDTDVLMLIVKILINHLQQFEEAIRYSEKIITIAKNKYIESNARLAIGCAYSQLASKVNSYAQSKTLLQSAISSLQKAKKLDNKDVEVNFHLAFNLALSKQINLAASAIQEGLAFNPSDLMSVHLLVLLLSAQKKYNEALEVLETSINEYPTDFGLLLTRIRLTEACFGSRAALVQCHNLLILWSNIFNINDSAAELENTTQEPIKSPSFSLRKPSFNDSKLVDATTSLKKVTLADGTSVYDEDGTSSIAASIRIEKALSESASGTIILNASSVDTPTAIVLLCKLWLVTGECFITIGDTTEASGCILEAAAVFPLSPDVLYMRGRLSELQKNRAEAIACYESALSVQNNHMDASQRLGLVYRDEGDLILAEKMLRNCLQNDSSNHTAWNDLGLILESSKRFDEAIDCFTTSLQLEQTSPIVPFTTLPRLFKAHENS